MRRLAIGIGVTVLATVLACGDGSNASGETCGDTTCPLDQKCFSGKYGSPHCAPPQGVGEHCDGVHGSTTGTIMPCADGLYCAPDWTCQALAEGGGACSWDEGCQSQHCFEGVCEPGPPRDATCTATSCPDGTYCELHKNPAVCLTKLPSGSSCADSRVCQSGVCCRKVCVDELCDI